MKKLLLSLLVLMTALGATKAQGAGLIVTNLTGDSTNLIYTGNLRIGQITVFGAQAGTVKVYDTVSNTLKYAVGSVTLATNYQTSVTNLTTNGIFIYSASTQYMIQTNIFVNGNFRTNITYPGLTNDYPVASSLAWVAGGVTTASPLDLICARGVTISTTTNVTVMIYTK